MRSPRPHQTRSVDFLRAHLLEGRRRVMLQMPTGGGKTLTAAVMVARALARGKRVIFVVPAVSLVDQTVESFALDGLRDVGVIQADHPLTDYSRPLQVASVQTLQARGMGAVPPAHLVVVDEAHRNFQFLRDWMAHPDWQAVPFIGLSATPWAKGLGKQYDALVIGQTAQGLIDAGYLAPFRVFAPAHPDLTGVKTQAGDYHEGQLAAVMAEGGLVASVVNTWLDKGENRPTLCFAVNRAHAVKLQAEFQAAGVGCGYIDAYTEAAERQAIRAKLAGGELRVVCNVGCLTTGVDWDVRCVILARPTKSEMLYVQMVGRGLRTADGKADCVILDHADNTLRMGFVTDIHKDELCDGTGRTATAKEGAAPLPKECPKCAFLRPPKVAHCPACGFKPERQSEVFEADGELAEVKGKRKFTMGEKQGWFSGLLWIERDRGYKPGWAANQYREKFQVWPNQLRRDPLPPTPEIESFVVSRRIRFAKSRGAA